MNSNFLSLRRLVWMFISILAFAPVGHAVIRDGGIDPSNLGRGSWIYIMPNALNQLGGNVPSVTNLTSLMTFMKNQGLQYVIIKAAQEDTVFKVGGATNFTTEIVNAGHAAGLKVFGYIYTTGANVPGEVAMADYIFQQGADGLIYDAEGEWESNTSGSTVGNNGPALATQLCSTIRANWPNKFMGLSTWPYRAVHSTLPYKEFAYYCDVIMPQAYWIELGHTPTFCVNRVNNEWNSWKNSLTGIWTNALKPFVMSGQGWNSTIAITAGQIGEYENALKTVSNPVSPGGFKSVDYWRAELHPMEVWNAIRTNFISNPYTNAPIIQVAPVVTVSSTTASISWPTDQNSDGAVEFGLTVGYGTSRTNAALVWYHTVNLTGLSANTTYHFRVRSKGSNNLVGVSSDYVLTTTSVTVADIVIDQNPANNSAGHQIAFTGSWTGEITGSAYLGTFRYASGVFTGTPTSTARFSPNIVTPGNYNVYASWAASSANGNRCTNAPFRINNGSVTTTTRVTQEANGNSFQLIGSNIAFAAGTSGYVELGNDVTASVGGDIVVADAVKFVYIPPPPSGPAISTQPMAQTVTQGNPATFLVAASGTAPMAYQWKFNGTNIVGATDSTYTRNNAQPSDAGYYSVSITNSVGSTNTANVLLTVNQYPTITLSPQDASVNPGVDVTFTVQASGTGPLSYQWKFEGENIIGANGTNFTRSNIQLDDDGVYSVLVTNMAGEASASATLFVIVPKPQIDFVGLLPDGKTRLQISGAPGNYSIDGTTNLASWTELTNTVSTNGIFEFTDPETNLFQRFYRARFYQ